MNLRQDIVDALTAGLPAGEWKIIGYPSTPTRVEKRTAAVWTSQITPQTGLGSAYDLEQKIEVTTPYESVENADDDLDGALLELLSVLWAMRSITFTSAERTVSQEGTQHSWTVTVHNILTAVPED